MGKVKLGHGIDYYKVNNFYRDPLMVHKPDDTDPIKVIMNRPQYGWVRPRNEPNKREDDEANLIYYRDEPGDLETLPPDTVKLPGPSHPLVIGIGKFKRQLRGSSEYWGLIFLLA